MMVLDEPERWLPVTGFEGIYEVSDQGRVRGIDRIDAAGRRWRGRTLATTPDRRGYLCLLLYRDGEQYHKKVHRLVLEAFVGQCPEGMEACHDPDRDPANNCLTNLRWDTKSENQYDRVRHGTNHNANKTHCPNGHPLEGLNLVPGAGKRYCLACNRAHRHLRRHPDAGNLQSVSDRYYAAIVDGSAKISLKDRTHCLRNHLLAEPNLVPGTLRRGRRNCLACNRAHGHIRFNPNAGDLQTVSDRYYTQIMQEMEENDGLDG